MSAQSGLILLGSALHFAGAADGIRTAGALGVALKCFGMVDYLRSWPATGSLVRMISVRASFVAACEVTNGHIVPWLLTASATIDHR